MLIKLFKKFIPGLVFFFNLGSVIFVQADITLKFEVDVEKNIRPISPLIYGSNTFSLTQGEGITFRRSGGNRLTGYNWENNASHAGTDWQNSSDGYLGGDLIPGKAITDFIDQTAKTGASSLITLQAAGFVAKDKNGTVTENETAPSPRWAKVVFAKGSAFTLTPNVNDGEVYMDEFVNFLVQKYGPAASGKGIRYYSLDNEPALWSSTHPRIHPTKVMAVELTDKSAALALAVKRVDPKAEIFGGVFYGYGAYADLQGAVDWPALKAAGNYGWYIDYFLDQMKKASDKAGYRLLDALDIHWYSEAEGDHRITSAGSNTDKDKTARMLAPRSLWDSTYAEKSWISQWQTPLISAGKSIPGPILLLPHIFASIQKYFPGTRLSISEYNYGAMDDISGGLAVADFLGIIGREGVFSSALWPLEDKLNYAAAAFRLYRNYDGKNSAFGSISASAKTGNNDKASIFASYNSGGDEIHIIVLNKSLTETIQGNFKVTSPVTISGGKAFSFGSDSAQLIEGQAIPSVVDNSFNYPLPPLSAHHFVLKTVKALPISNLLRKKSSRTGPELKTVSSFLVQANGRFLSSEKGRQATSVEFHPQPK